MTDEELTARRFAGRYGRDALRELTQVAFSFPPKSKARSFWAEVLLKLEELFPDLVA